MCGVTMKLISCLILLSVVPSSAQSVSSTELYGPVPAAQVFNALGTNITSTNEWEYEAARAAHITWGRFDCSWQKVEKQKLPENLSAGYNLPPECASGLRFGTTYGVHQIVDALYGAPFGAVATAITTADSKVGATLITLAVSSGSLDSVVPGQSYLKAGSKLSSKQAYAGTLIVTKGRDSVTLASALTADLPARSKVTLNLQLYAPVLIPVGASYQTNPSLQAYGRYVHYLQTQVAASGLSGRVSLWNEPPWGGDPWDEAANLYDNAPPENRLKSKFGVELAYYASTLPPVRSALLDNGYTNKTGVGSLFVPDRISSLPSKAVVHQSFASESFHPYGNNPEDGAWLPSCVKTHNSASSYGQVFQDCTPAGMVAGSNIKWQAAFSRTLDKSQGLDIGITETGICRRCGGAVATETQVSRFNLRQFLVFSGSDVHPILFYRLAQDPQFEWLHQDHSPYPVYVAFQSLMTDIGKIAADPVSSYPSCSLPKVSSYAGEYPLADVNLVGSRPGDKANSQLLFTWQRSYSSGKWLSLQSPTPAELSLMIPEGLKVASVKDVVALSQIEYRVSGRLVTYRVADNPIEVTLIPVSSSTTPSVCN